MEPTENHATKKAPLRLSYTALAAILAGYYSLVVNLPIYAEFYRILSALDNVHISFIVAIPLFIFCIVNIIFNVFSWPYVAKPIFIFFIVSSSLVSYAMMFYGINVDYGMIENTFETDVGEATSYLSLQSLSWVGTTGILPAILVALAPMKSGPGLLKKLIAMLLSALLLALVLFFTYKDFSSVGRNNSYLKTMVIPTYYTYSTYQYIRNTYFSTPTEYRQIGLDAKQASKTPDEKPTLFFFILGETARSQNYALNGYKKNTNPYTEKQDVVSFQHVSSCGTATAVSVPCMFSQLKQKDYDKNQANSQDNVLDLLNRAGISLLWKENDGGDKEVARHIKKIEIDRSQVNQYCNGSTCLDMALLDGIKDEVANMQGHNKMLVMHIMGSHGPTYYLRYPKEQQHFLPDCPRSDIENCSTEEIINTYDNTIVYTDYVISQAIDTLKSMGDDYNTALFYVSDHGESLGENGLFLHGVPRAFAPETQTTVPLITWMSEGFKNSKALNETCLREEANTNAFSHDNLFSSLLGIMDVNTEAYQQDLDLFHPCRG
ncbi:phosphoethanolamine transferase [Marinomonas sp. IMCC 4694]|uniref:phosphoethanolamine transferase n=1 Tax=Marinomonas sp. IMCC 4694 TaxID=2605432 RepID=UPI0011E7B7D9|nr:phosphoethanolamine--lipid A transferase [Marinomonas sp. IMCC 4694]TYL47003.1 phosphoethanolamine--lipid A transferase [Marinomonas sp. IMCC 4694]